jgi:hypothetical protein
VASPTVLGWHLVAVYVPEDLLKPRLTAAVLPAIAFLIIVHGAVLAGFLAALRLCGKTSTANRCRQNRKQNFGIIFHQGSLACDPK